MTTNKSLMCANTNPYNRRVCVPENIVLFDFFMYNNAAGHCESCKEALNTLHKTVTCSLYGKLFHSAQYRKCIPEDPRINTNQEWQCQSCNTLNNSPFSRSKDTSLAAADSEVIELTSISILPL
ncbi:unnamed protein product [Orchesella dallaii]|uniref:Uncharacterized protein n=1 Tax=Orchesella dallaii TaxID=48710 RepID=A0ABP1QSM3_9HEXA